MADAFLWGDRRARSVQCAATGVCEVIEDHSSDSKHTTRHTHGEAGRLVLQGFRDCD